MSEGKKNLASPVKNDELEKVILSFKEGSTPEKQQQLSEALKKAHLLSPTSFEETRDANGRVHVKPDQIKFFLVNMNNGKTFYPVFTSFEKAKAIQFGPDKPKYIVRTMKDLGLMLSPKDGKAEGVIINPNSDDIVIPKNLVLLVAGMTQKPEQQQKPKQNNVVKPVYSEPRVYPTKMVTAVYDAVSELEDVKRVWLKQKLVGPVIEFLFVVESGSNQDEITNVIKEVATPLSKGVGIDVMFYNDFVENEIIKGAVALYDRELEL